MEIRCMVIDDEPLAISRLEKFIEKVPSLKLIRSFDNSIEALIWLKENSIDLIFLDIQMETFTGMQFLETIELKPRIIITSAYDQYALKGFEFNVSDYLLKPFPFERFVKAVEKVIEYYAVRKEDTKVVPDTGNSLFVKTEYRYERINIDDILYIEGMKDYLRIVCPDRKIMTLQSFAKIEESLPSKKFCRVHKSYMIAIDKIRSVERGVVLIGDQRIPVSATYREIFNKKTGLKLHQ
jgi:two-component system, LytTR family, response regulator